MAAKKMKRVPIRIDMTPMVDVAFLLLIFFMSTSQFDPPQKIPISIPDSHSNLKVPESDVLILGISKDNQLLWQLGKNPQQFTDLASLPQLVLDQRRRNPRLRVAIKSDKDSNYGTMEDVMKIMQDTKTITFSLVTELVASKKSALHG
ncbi:MAG TPA: biopolymer transporter ExbD [Candidatus Eisenbacteria bacterium]|jgi:biopolymer transport protein ExbD|nr:biopolymer transporter ExbD [Candidatus Eisenbacteria bacterium]